MQQHTLAAPFLLEGTGIHTGAPCRVIVHPAGADTGRKFEVGGTVIPARVEYVVDTNRSTTLGRNNVRVQTVEHLLAALYGAGVDNARIEVFGPEIPILDGSAAPFVQAIQSVGMKPQDRPARQITLTAPVEIAEGHTLLRAEPADSFACEVHTRFDHWPEGQATVHIADGPNFAGRFAAEIAPARTFAFRQEVDALITAGLARGGTTDNALIITPPETFSTPLRRPGEWCAHKLLDMIGDLALLDARLRLRLYALRPGHRANIRLAALIREKGTT